MDKETLRVLAGIKSKSSVTPSSKTPAPTKILAEETPAVVPVAEAKDKFEGSHEYETAVDKVHNGILDAINAMGSEKMKDWINTTKTNYAVDTHQQAVDVLDALRNAETKLHTFIGKMARAK